MKSLSTAINESVSRTKLVNMIYKEVERLRLTSKLYKDEYWQGPSDVFNCIRDVIAKTGGDYELVVNVPNGGYRKSKDGMSEWKEYELEIISVDDGKTVIIGMLNAHAAGKVSDPFSEYDMSLILNKA